MADFKTALIALSNGEIAYEVIEENIGKILNRNPALAIEILEQLEDAFNATIIDAEEFAKFKSYVTQLSARENPEISIADEARAAIGNSGDFDLALDFDLSPVTENPARNARDKASTDTSWPEDNNRKRPNRKSLKIEPGTVIRGRFQLDKVLGVGGMGTVFRGRDLIKVEARDKNPYVAIKILNEDFKDHPDGFIALQREASRQQKLAHPNIATVYDFDRTEDGTFFLTMELLQGQPLNRYIRKVVKPQKGLPFEQAFPMIEGLANALIYAHEHDIVHSDFKPGNCFITNDGVMKVLDFGIARAVKTPGHGDTTDKTIFDPGKLGALTPPYASVEMLEELEPDTRDDIYALACVAYELLTGKHPFNKLRATTARDNQLVPIPIKGLKRSQIRALNRGLGFTREERSQTVKAFLEELRGDSSPFSNPWITIPSVAVILAAIGIFPLVGLMQDREIDRLVDALRSEDTQTVESTLNHLQQDGFNKDVREQVLVVARDSVLAHYEEKIASHVNLPASQLNLPEAYAVIDEVSQLSVFADSSQVATWRNRLQKVEGRLLNQYSLAFSDALLQDNLLDLDDRQDVHDVLVSVQNLDPEVGRVMRMRLPGAYAAAIQRAIVNQEFERAVALSQAGLKMFPEDPYLSDLDQKIAGAQEQTQLTTELNELENRIRDTLAVSSQLKDFVHIQEAVQKIAFLTPKARVLDELRETVAALISDVQTQEDALLNLNTLLNALGLFEASARYQATKNESIAAITNLFSELRTQILLPGATINSPEISRLLDELNQYPTQYPMHNNALLMAARWTINQARRARSLGNFSDASRILDELSAYLERRLILPSVNDEKQIISALVNNNAVHYVQNSDQQNAQFDRQAAELREQLGDGAIDASKLDVLFGSYDALTATNPVSAQLTRYRQLLLEKTLLAAKFLEQEGNKQTSLDLLSRLLTFFPDDQPSFDAVMRLMDQREVFALDDTSTLQQELDALLSEPTIERRWQQNMLELYLELERKLPPGSAWLAERRGKISDSLLAAAASAQTEQQFALSDILLWRAEPFTEDLTKLQNQRTTLKSAETAFVMQHRRRDRDAQTLGLKFDFDTQLKASDLASATQTFHALKLQSSGETPIELDALRNDLADAYLRLASQEAAIDNTTNAIQILRTGLNTLPQNALLAEALAQQQSIALKRQLTQSLQEDDFDLALVINQLEQIRQLDASGFSENAQAWGQALGQHLNTLSSAQIQEGIANIAALKSLFPSNAAIQGFTKADGLAPEGFDALAEIARLQAQQQLSAARRLLDQVPAEQRKDARFGQLSAHQQAQSLLAREHFSKYKAALEADDTGAAREQIFRALDVWRDNQIFINESQTWKIQDDASQQTASLDQAANDSKCMHKLAGMGKRLSGTCFDMLSPSTRGPLLVVVPAPAQTRGAFAIGKFEVTVGDFNAYCSQTEKCTPDLIQDKNLPQTLLSQGQIEGYLAWLSEITGANYRLPSIQEWQYAARADDQQLRGEINCRVVQNGEIVMGSAVWPIDRGKANAWGMYNTLGNVREVTTDGTQLVNLGGSYADEMDDCSLDYKTQHLGTPEQITGLRVLREF